MFSFISEQHIEDIDHYSAIMLTLMNRLMSIVTGSRKLSLATTFWSLSFVTSIIESYIVIPIRATFLSQINRPKRIIYFIQTLIDIQ